MKKNNSVIYHNEFEKIKIKKYDLIICYGYGKILTEQQISRLQGNIINLHIGYLPFARGIYPIIWSLVFSKPIGITFHLIENKKIDCGKICFRKIINIKKKDTLKKIHFKCRFEIEKYFFKNYNKIFELKKIAKYKVSKNKMRLFTKKQSKKLLSELPNMWNTTAGYIRSNSKKYKQLLKKSDF